MRMVIKSLKKPYMDVLHQRSTSITPLELFICFISHNVFLVLKFLLSYSRCSFLCVFLVMSCNTNDSHLEDNCGGTVVIPVLMYFYKFLSSSKYLQYLKQIDLDFTNLHILFYNKANPKFNAFISEAKFSFDFIFPNLILVSNNAI